MALLNSGTNDSLCSQTSLSISVSPLPSLFYYLYIGHVSASEHVDGSQASWTDKIMSMKGQDEKTSDQPEGVDEDEWDD